MDNKKKITVGFAIFATMVILLTISPKKIEAIGVENNSSTQATNDLGENTCRFFFEKVLQYMASGNFEMMQHYIDLAQEEGCVWATTMSIDVGMQNNPVQMGVVKIISSSQSTCPLCANK